MYAQCPECLTFFHVKPTHLKAAKGRVRCSRCKQVFDALETLRDDLTPAEIAAVEAERRREPKADAPLLSEEFVGDLFDSLDYTANEELPLGEPGAVSTRAGTGHEPTIPMTPDFNPPRARPRHRAVVISANVLLLLLLGAQLAHWQRFELLRHPLLGQHVAYAYAALGVRIEPPHDLAALRVYRTEVGSHPDHPSALHLTAVLENRGRAPQPWPELRVDLQDRWGETVGARYFTPAEYLREPDAGERPLPPDERFAIELVILDPGSEAVGFRVEPCFENGQRHVCPADVD